MLFDLRRRGRRRTVQLIYAGLAVLIGGGLVLFGVGSTSNGGLLDAFNGSNGSGSTDSIFATQLRGAERTVQLRPGDAAAWASLARIRYQVAGQGGNYDSNTATFTASGQSVLRQVGDAWDHYLALNPPHPDVALATLMLQAFGPGGLNQPARAVRAAEIVSEANPTFTAYEQLAAFAYLAGQTRKGDLATSKAIALAPKAQRSLIRQRLDQVKASAASGTGSGTTATTTSGG